MRRRAAQRLAKLYPSAWRALRAEFLGLLEVEPLGPRVLLDVMRHAVAERLFDLSGLETGAMVLYPASVLTLARRPSGFIPILMSLTALAVVIGTLATVGPARQPDEGAAAHVFQLLIVGEAPPLAFFVVRWLRTEVRATLTVMAIQAVAIGLSLFPVWWFRL